MSAAGRGKKLLYQMFNRVKIKFLLPNAACGKITNNRFDFITRNFIITTITKGVTKGFKCIMKA